MVIINWNKVLEQKLLDSFAAGKGVYHHPAWVGASDMITRFCRWQQDVCRDGSQAHGAGKCTVGSSSTVKNDSKVVWVVLFSVAASTEDPKTFRVILDQGFVALGNSTDIISFFHSWRLLIFVLG
jgi:hypothetical protein